LSVAYPVFRNQGNYSGRFGLPVSLGRLTPEARIAVLEMAADSYDEVRHLADVTRPRVGVVTSVSASHLEFFGSLEQIAREKARLVQALPPDGVAALNGDDARVLAMGRDTAARVITYGLSDGVDLRGSDVEVTPSGLRLRAHWQEETAPLRLPLIGAHHAYTALAATAVGLAYGLSWADIQRGLERVEPLPGRTRLLAGINGSLLLDDSYNANPDSALAALEALAALPARRRYVVLGDMTQLGYLTEQGHRLVGDRCARVADRLLAKGELARLAAEQALRAGMPPESVTVAYTARDVVQSLREALVEGDLVLLKGSAEARLEQVTWELLADPGSAADVLPRQGAGWAQVRLARPGRPTWVEIDLDALAHNVGRIVGLVGPDVAVMAVLKADGYGHGAIKVARTALNNGVRWLGVACLGEAIALRRAGIAAPILILGYTPPWQAREAVLHEAVCTVFSRPVAEALSRAAADLGRIARVHVKVDTGMGRFGLLPEQALPFVQDIQGLRGLAVDGIFSHLASADELDLTYTRWQLERFEGVLQELRLAGLLPHHVHIANSAAVLRLPESHYNMVRVGLVLYGLNPSEDSPCPADFCPALAFKCQVAQVKALDTGSYVSYGRTFRTERPSRIAVIPVGYADGFRRAPYHWGYVLVRGQRAPIVGRVCMDQTMIDVTDIPGVRDGDEVVLIGSQGGERITVDDVARRLGTINYEVVSEILARVPRVV
ncbi:MAG: alanine racemase, partial [Chloroflexi bacterium]|nr:alanine racemase [Chloroflexota bacterium]